MAEEAESAVREVHNRADDDECDNPAAKLVQHRKTRADEQLNEVITCPGDHIADIEARSRHEGTCCGTNQVTHIVDDKTKSNLVIGDRSLTPCRAGTTFSHSPLEERYHRTEHSQENREADSERERGERLELYQLIHRVFS